MALNRTIFSLLLVFVLVALTMIIPSTTTGQSLFGDTSNNNEEDSDIQHFKTYENKLYTFKRPQFTLSLYLPENKSEFADKQKIEVLVALAWLGTPSQEDEIEMLGNKYVIGRLKEERMYKFNITILGDENKIFNLSFVYNNVDEIVTFTYYTNLTTPAIPYFFELPILLQPKKKPQVKLEKETVIVLEEKFKEEMLKAQTLIIALVIAITMPFLARYIKRKIKYEIFTNSFNIPVFLGMFIATYFIVLFMSGDLYTTSNFMTIEFKHELYARVFVARELVGMLIVGLAFASYNVGWKLTDLENVHPMLVVSPELQYIELWYVVIYKEKVNGVMETCIAPINYGSVWRRLLGRHIVLQRQQYVVKFDPKNNQYELVTEDIDAPLESGWSFGKMFMKVFDNLILAEDIELYDDYGEQLLTLMENMSEEEIELRKKNYKEWKKRYGSKYRLKPVTKMRIVLSDAHYNPFRIIYDANVVKTLLSKLKAYENRYNILRSALPEIADVVVAKNLLLEVKKHVPTNMIAGDISEAVDNLIDSIAFNIPMSEITGEEEIPEEVRQALMESDTKPNTNEMPQM